MPLRLKGPSDAVLRTKALGHIVQVPKINFINKIYFWACSSAGRALDLHSRGQEFDPPQVHKILEAYMPPKPEGMPIAFAIIFAIFWFLIMAGMTVGWVIMVVSGWKIMKAHEKIANKLSEIAEKLQSK